MHSLPGRHRLLRAWRGLQTLGALQLGVQTCAGNPYQGCIPCNKSPRSLSRLMVYACLSAFSIVVGPEIRMMHMFIVPR